MWRGWDTRAAGPAPDRILFEEDVKSSVVLVSVKRIRRRRISDEDDRGHFSKFIKHHPTLTAQDSGYEFPTPY